MSLERTSAGRRASLCGRVLARLRAERGDTLMEVIVAALMVALIATASLGGFSDVGKLSETQRNEEQAATLAQQDQARLRGLTITQLASSGTGAGNTSSTTTIDGTTYKVTSGAAFISGSTGTSACSGSSGADEVQTTSTVTWGRNFANGGRNPVVLHGLITPAEGGALVATVVDPTLAGLAGVTISLSGPTGVSPVTTDSSGCVIWTGLAAGSYTVSYAPPAGTWITSTGSAPSSQTVSVTAAQTTHAAQVEIGQAASVQAGFSTNWTGTPMTNESDTFMLFDTTGSSPTSQIFGNDSSTRGSNTYTSPLSTSTNLFPYAASLPSDDYDAYAGGCTGDDPGRTNDPGFTLTGGQVNGVTIPEPALLLQVYGNSFDDNSASLTYTGTWVATTGSSKTYNGTEHTTIVQNSTVTVHFTGTGIQWIGTNGKNTTYGAAKVTLDGTNEGNFPSSFPASTTYQQVLYSVTGLTNTSHTLVLTANTNALFVSVDAFNVVGGTPNVAGGSPAPETIAPTVSITDKNTGCGSNVDYPPTQIPTASQGALQFPGEIYGSLTVCADDGTYKNTASVTNNVFTSPGNPVTINLYNGAAGLTAGTC